MGHTTSAVRINQIHQVKVTSYVKLQVQLDDPAEDISLAAIKFVVGYPVAVTKEYDALSLQQLLK